MHGLTCSYEIKHITKILAYAADDFRNMSFLLENEFFLKIHKNMS